jgi:hypothetical protein
MGYRAKLGFICKIPSESKFAELQTPSALTLLKDMGDFISKKTRTFAIIVEVLF